MSDHDMRIFKNGRSRAMRIPSEFDLDTDEVTLSQKEDGSMIVTPKKKLDLLDYLVNRMPLAEKDWPEPVDRRARQIAARHGDQRQ